MKSQSFAYLLALSLAAHSFAFPLFATIQLPHLTLRQGVGTGVSGASGSDDNGITVTTEPSAWAPETGTGTGVALTPEEQQESAW